MDPYIGEIRMFGGNFAPRGWALCDGRTLSIAEHDALFSLLGTTYGGNGSTTFAVPDLRGRVPIHQDASHPIGSRAGVERVTLIAAQFPAHSHAFKASAAPADSASPAGNVLAEAAGSMYREGDPNVDMNPAAIGASTFPDGQPYGSSSPQPHENMQPFQCVNFIIALVGIFPPRD